MYCVLLLYDLDGLRADLCMFDNYFDIQIKIANFIYLFSFFQSTINIVFDRVGKKDPVTRGLEIVVHWLGWNIDVAFWSQHVSFILVGCIVLTSIRGLLLTLTKVSFIFLYILF